MTKHLALVVALLGVAGCGKKKDEPKHDTTETPPAAPVKAAEPPPPPPAPDAAAPKAAELVEHDLSSQGAEWAGWSVKAPADGKLEKYEGATPSGIAIRWGNGEGAMGFSSKKLVFKAIKKETATGGDTKVVKELADEELDTVQTVMGKDVKCFYVNLQVDKKTTVGCWTVTCPLDDVGVAQAHAICNSLAKK